MARLKYESNRVTIETPYAQPFVDALKSHVPHGYRNWDGHSRVWRVFQPYVGEARRLTLLYFPDAEESNRAEFDSAQREQQARQERAEQARREQAERDANSHRYEGFFRGNFGGRPGSGPHGSQNGSGRANGAQSTQTPRGDFATLYVATDAPREVVEAAYRALSRKYHPDLNRGSDTTEQMQRLNAAYDAVKRLKGWN